MTAGQTGACLNTMAILQAHQADLLRELDEGEEVGPDSIKKLYQATDLCLHAIKETAHAVYLASRRGTKHSSLMLCCFLLATLVRL